MHVYVVDDDADVRNVITIALQRAGHCVQSFATAEAFLSVAEDLSPGCIILDYCMPGMDGLEAQQQLMSRNSPHRIILFTGVGEIPEAVRAIRAGAIDVLTKPYRRSELLEAIVRAEAELQQIKSINNDSNRHGFEKLSEKELSILAASSNGQSSKRVAHECGLSVRTIEMHRSNIIKKLNVENFAGALLSFNRNLQAAQKLSSIIAA